MRCMKKILGQLGCVLSISLALIGQVFAEDIKYSNEDIEKIVLEAKNFAIAKGKDAALKAFMDQNNAQFRKGSVYVSAFDFNGVCLAHIKAAMVGAQMIGLKDQNGVPLIKNLIAAAKDAKGGWAEYMWQNPVTNKVEKKYSFAMKIDDNWWITTGLYESEKK